MENDAIRTDITENIRKKSSKIQMSEYGISEYNISEHAQNK